MTGGPRRVVVAADGGSRGNPGPAAYGAVLVDADTGQVLAEDGDTLGRATNNVAEYEGLLAGLRLAAEYAPQAEVEVRMDSKLVVEQMAGRWQVKHPAMKPLHARARALAPAGTTWTWVPRAENSHADRLANEALDGVRTGVRLPDAEGRVPGEEPPTEPQQPPAQGWAAATGTPTTLLLVRHGVTPLTAGKRFSGGLGGSNPGLSDEGRDQVRATGEWLAPAASRIEAVVASPVRRTRESAEVLAACLGDLPVVEEPGIAEMEFGHWDGLTFAEVGERHHDELAAWLGSTQVAPRGGESFAQVQTRVLAGLDRVLEEYAGRTVALVSHVTPIKIVVAHALGAPLESVFRMELSPASVTVVTVAPGGRASLRLYNALPPGRDGFAAPSTTW